MRSFKNYTPKRTTEEPATLSAKELTQKLATAWNGKSSRDMLAEILSEAEISKRQGTLTNAEIDEFYTQFSALLSPAEQKMLRSVVERLKKI